MKKLFLTLMFLFLSVNVCYATSITVDSIITPDDLTIPWINAFKNTVVNTLNSFPGDNIQSGSVTYASLDANTSPINRWNEAFNDFVYTGLLPPTSTDLVSVTTAGTAYIEGQRVVKDATSHTYTASKDTYLDLSSNGTYTYNEVANGAAEPTTTAHSIRLAKLVTDGTKVASVTDMRVTGVQITTSEDFNLKGMNLLWTAIDRISVDSGVVYHGSTRIGKTTITGLDMDTTAQWLTGASERGVSKWIYIYVSSSGTIYFSASAPDYHDTSGDTDGIKYYYKSGTTYYRYLGAIYLNATGSGNVSQFYQRGNWFIYETAPTVTSSISSGAWSAAVSCSASIPPTSTLGKFVLNATTGGGITTITLSIRPHGSNWGTADMGAYVNGLAAATGAADLNYVIDCPTDSSRQINHYEVCAGGTATVKTKGYFDESR